MNNTEVQEAVRSAAARLLAEDRVSMVIGYGPDPSEEVCPVFIQTSEQAEHLVWNAGCLHNLATYLSREYIKKRSPVALVVKGCDMRAVNMLLKEHVIKRENVVLIGVPCDGVGEPILSKCRYCEVHTPSGVDELMPGEPTADLTPEKEEFAGVDKIDEMDSEDRWGFWKEHFERCIRCYACRQACPMCYCKRCITEKTQPQWIEFSAHLRGNFSWNVIRAFHLTGRCIGCGECERVCPAHIPIGEINRKLAKFVQAKFDYKAGMDPETPSPFTTYDLNIDNDEGNSMSIDSKFIEGEWRQKLLDALSKDGYIVLAPMLEGEITRYRPCESAADIVLDRVNTQYPLKEVFFPMTESLLEYQNRPGEDLAYAPLDAPESKIAVLGCRPCDAASVAIMDSLFNWDYEDALYSNRRDGSLILSVGCVESDDRCFCTSVRIGPESTEGSDIVIQESGGKGAVVKISSEKGSAFAEAHKELFVEVPGDIETPVADVPVRFDIEKIKPWLDNNFHSDFWDFVAMKCLGCGACSYLCPTCHCFDVVDEANWQAGERRRNYDCCTYSFFTLHASGHNPRPTMASRYRNRIMHKFHYFVERLDRVACVGCGRCIRVCGVGMNLIDILKSIESQPEEKTVAEK